PLIINSSKTAAEIKALQAELAIEQAFICENGAAVYQAGEQGSYHTFARPRAEVLEVINSLRQSSQYQFTGFADCDAEGIQAMTGLSLEQSLLASERGFSEPLLWQDTEPRLQAFIQQLAGYGLVAQQGGRFLSVMSAVDKASAMQWWCRQYYPGVKTIALGDSPNDQAMLNAADIAVLIQSSRSASMQIAGPEKIISTTLTGPAGWQQAMDQLLPLFID
ncbi:MAG: HAD hydrolase family protein, partial [Oceanicoccus sp.]|uniref:HAD-IIB family hydrolase n=1 Tax=Oceanicoccus sp. TaxID=2691044 RepID=UPI00261892BC